MTTHDNGAYVKPPRWLRAWWWLHDETPLILPDWLLDRAIRAYSWSVCRVRGHEPWVEMDGHSIVCVICTKVLGDTNAR